MGFHNDTEIANNYKTKRQTYQNVTSITYENTDVVHLVQNSTNQQMSEAQKGRAIKYVKSDNGERLHNVVEPFPQRNYRLPNDITNTYSLQKRNI